MIYPTRDEENWTGNEWQVFNLSMPPIPREIGRTKSKAGPVVSPQII